MNSIISYGRLGPLATAAILLLLLSTPFSANAAAVDGDAIAGRDLQTNNATTAECECECSNNVFNAEEEHVIRILQLRVKPKTGFAFMGLEKTAQQHYETTGIKIEFDYISDKQLRTEELRSQLQHKLDLYDGFVLPSILIGTAAQFDGFIDLTDVVRMRPELNWLDIFLGFRENVAVYDNRIFLFPLDGDANYMFYRKDVLEHYNLTVPRTWDEFWQVSKVIHGKEYKGKVVYGSCLGRKAGEGAGAYWAMDILSSYTQTKGKVQGFLFDPEDLSPLMGEAMSEAIKMLEMQVRYGHPNEFGDDDEFGGGGHGSINVVAMNAGECAMTYNWGDSFSQSYISDPPSQIKGLMNVAALPGADKVLNRETMRLEQCTKKNCGGIGGQEFDDIGWVNRAPFLAGGGWAGAVNNNINQERKERMLDFFVELISPETSINNLVQNADAALNDGTGVDPFRASHFNISKWVEAGYEKSSVESYEKAVIQTAKNPNAAIDIRFAGTDGIYFALADEIQPYLEMTRTDTLPENEEEKQQLRLQIAEKISQRFTQIVKDENAKPETAIPMLEQYQRDLGIYKPEINYNQIGSLRYFGFVMLAIILLASIGFAIWVFLYQTNRVVQFSQPPFLYLLCVGTFVLGSAILPLSMDDSFFGLTDEHCPGCDKACVAWPWLFCTGFSIVFSTLFSKLWRVNKLIKASVQFKRIRALPQDVMRPFAVIFSLNIILLTIWTAVDPPQYQRFLTDELNSYGTCRPYGTGSDGDMTASIVLLSLLAAVNISALVLAQVQAFKARHITCEVLSESKYISLATFANLQVFVIGLPLMFLVEENPSAKYFVQVGIVFVVCMGILLLIFCPKVYYVRKPPESWNVRNTVQILRASAGQTISGIGRFTDAPIRQAGALADKEEELTNKELEHLEYKQKVHALYENLKKNYPDLESSLFSSLLPDDAITVDEVMEKSTESEHK